jgi:hypothetical protein
MNHPTDAELEKIWGGDYLESAPFPKYELNFQAVVSSEIRERLDDCCLAWLSGAGETEELIVWKPSNRKIYPNGLVFQISCSSPYFCWGQKQLTLNQGKIQSFESLTIDGVGRCSLSQEETKNDVVDILLQLGFQSLSQEKLKRKIGFTPAFDEVIPRWFQQDEITVFDILFWHD